MKNAAIFAAGMATGWVLRASFDSMRGLAVSAVATSYDFAARAKRLVAVEREYFEDMIAEGRARFETQRARAEAKRAAKVAVSEARH